MQLSKVFLALTSIVAMVSSSPIESSNALDARAGCGSNIGPCYENGCNPAFGDPNDTIGTCQSGDYRGCGCDKCASYIDYCVRNGCEGINAKCTKGPYRGCPCKY